MIVTVPVASFGSFTTTLASSPSTTKSPVTDIGAVDLDTVNEVVIVLLSEYLSSP